MACICLRLFLFLARLVLFCIPRRRRWWNRQRCRGWGRSMARSRVVQLPPKSVLGGRRRRTVAGGAQLDARQAISVIAVGGGVKDRECVQHLQNPKLAQPEHPGPPGQEALPDPADTRYAGHCNKAQEMPAGLRLQLARMQHHHPQHKQERQMHPAINMIQLSRNSSATLQGWGGREVQTKNRSGDGGGRGGGRGSPAK